MVNINIAIPEDLHKKLKLASVMKNTTLKELIIQILEEKTRNKGA